MASLPSPLSGHYVRYTVSADGFDEAVPGVSSFQAEASFTRLLGAGLIAVTNRGGTMGPERGDTLSDLRITAAGLVVLGEWPDFERIATAAGIHHLLRAAAEDAPEEAQSALRRAAGLVGRTADGVVRDTLLQTAGAVGGDMAGGQ